MTDDLRRRLVTLLEQWRRQADLAEHASDEYRCGYELRTCADDLDAALRASASPLSLEDLGRLPHLADWRLDESGASARPSPPTDDGVYSPEVERDLSENYTSEAIGAAAPPPEGRPPELDNHHNAATCPYCNPQLEEQKAALLTAQTAARDNAEDARQVREAMHQTEDQLKAAQSDRQLIADILEEYWDEHTKDACDRCEQCGEVVMCGFHSVLSALRRSTWTNGAIERDRLRKQLKASEAAAQQAGRERDTLREALREAEEFTRAYQCVDEEEIHDWEQMRSIVEAALGGHDVLITEPWCLRTRTERAESQLAACRAALAQIWKTAQAWRESVPLYKENNPDWALERWAATALFDACERHAKQIEEAAASASTSQGPMK